MIRKDHQLVSELGSRLNQLKENRVAWESHWDKIISLVNPRRGLMTDNESSAKRRGVEIYSSEALHALQTWADGMKGYLVSPSMNWFRLTTPDRGLQQSIIVKAWLQEVEEAMYLALGRSNFYSAMDEYFLDAGSVGTAVMFSEEDLGDGSIDFMVRHPRECFISENRRGRVDTLYREFPMSLRTLVDTFGKEGLPLSMQEAVDKTPFKKVSVFHALFPGSDRSAQLKVEFKKTFSSVYWISEEQTVLRESGYDLFPCQVWRTRKNVDEEYGRSPASDALVEVMGLNAISKGILKQVQLAAEPPLNVPEELKGRARFNPGGHNYYQDGQRLVSPMLIAGDIRGAMDREGMYRQSIKDHFSVDFFMLLNSAEKTMTATEIVERQGEKAVVMGAQVGRLQSECLNPLMDRVFDIEFRAGRLPPPPQEVINTPGARIDIDYLGPLAQAQKRLFKTQGINQSMAALEPMMVAFPEVRHILDPIKVAREIMDANGMPQSTLRTDDEVAVLVDADRQQAAAQQQAELAKTVATAANQGRRTIEPGSAADMAKQEAGL